MKYIMIHSKINYVVMFYLLHVVSMDTNCIHYNNFECILGEELFHKKCNETIRYSDCDVLFIFDNYSECYNKLINMSHIKNINDYNSYFRKLKIERINSHK